ncbi:rho operon leader peptide [Superficieibacter sp.]|nr:rho operon leader peptide [Superficieibacter sp.]
MPGLSLNSSCRFRSAYSPVTRQRTDMSRWPFNRHG